MQAIPFGEVGLGMGFECSEPASRPHSTTTGTATTVAPGPRGTSRAGTVLAYRALEAAGRSVRRVGGDPCASHDHQNDRTRIHVAGNRQLLELLVEKLVDNAVEHAATGTAVEVSLRRVGAQASLTVRNVGNPLPSDRARLFELGVTSKGATDRDHFGIGLYLAQLIAERHAGRIEALDLAGEAAGAELRVTFARSGAMK